MYTEKNQGQEERKEGGPQACEIVVNEQRIHQREGRPRSVLKLGYCVEQIIRRY